MSRPRADLPPACSICRATLDGDGLTFTVAGFGSSRVAVGRYCDERCRDAARAVSAVLEAPLGAAAETRRKREAVADALLACYHRRVGPEPSAVLAAADRASAVAKTSPADQ